MAIFDITENNPNVLVETGIAFGAQKPVILLRAESASTPLPTDLGSFVYLPYEDRSELASRSIVSKIVEAIQKTLDAERDLFYFRKLWSLSPRTSTYVIPGQLPGDLAANPFDDFIRLRNYTDLDALFLIAETFTRLYPMNVSIRAARNVAELPGDWARSNLVFVGGPDFNPLVSEFDSCCPIEYVYGGQAEVWLRSRLNGREFVPSFERRGARQLATDYGFVVKVPHPHSEHARLVFIGGARTWGVYGAAMLVGCEGLLGEVGADKHVRSIVHALGDDPSFLAIVRVRGTEEGAYPPEFDLQDLEILEGGSHE
jgi:hypothetical protein